MASSSSSSSVNHKFCDRMETIPQPLLPQHGGPASSTNSFTALLPSHPFLFRVYTPHARQNLRSPSPAHSRFGSRASSRTRPSSRAASPPPSRSISVQHHHSPPSRPLSRHSSYFSSSHTTVDDGDGDEPFFLSPRSKELRDAASDIGSPSEWRPRPRTLSTLSRFSGMSGMSGFSDISTTAGAMSDSWTSVGAETTADEDMMIDVDSEDKEAENTVSELGLTRSLSSALIVPHSPTKMHRRAMSSEARSQPASMSSSMAMPGLSEDSQVLDEKPSLSTLLAHLDPGKRTTSPCVSASMSFFYAIWEAVRRYKINVKYDVEIAIIDGRAFVEDDEEEGTVQSVWTVDEMMRMKEPDSTINLDDPSIAKPLAHLVASHIVLIQGVIPSSAVYSSLQLREIIPALPGYFFKHQDGHQAFDSKTFESLIWDAFATSSSPEKKRRSQTSFRQFCATASKAFMSDERSHGDRIRDSTTGAVNLAGACVGRWAKGRIQEVLRHERAFGGEEEDPFADPPDPEELRRRQLEEARDEIKLAVTHLTMLIAAWPSRSWFDTHLAEINGLIDDVVEIYMTGLIDAAQTDMSSGGDERRGREEMRDGRRVHSPIPTRRAFSITRGFHSPPSSEIPVTPPRTPPHTPPNSISRAGSERARMRSPLAFGERDSPSSVGKGIGRSLSFGGVLDSGRQDSSGGDSVSGSASAAGGLLPSAEIVAPRPHPPSRSSTPAQSTLHSRPSTPPIGSSVHFATPSPAPSPARHHSEIKRPKSPLPPVPPRRSSMRTNSSQPTSFSSSSGKDQNQAPAPFPTMFSSPQPERSSSVSSRASLPHSKSQPDGILRKAAKEGSDDGSTKEKNSRLTWPRTLKRVVSVPGDWPKENGSSDSVAASSEKGGSSVKSGEASLSKRNSLFGKPRQRTVTLTRATTGPKKDREIPKEMETEHKDEHGESAEKRRRKLSLSHLDLGLHLGDLFKRGTKKGKEKQKGSVIAGAIAAGALATQASGMISKPSSKSTSAGVSSTVVREDSLVHTLHSKGDGIAQGDEKADNASSTSLSKSQEHSREATESLTCGSLETPAISSPPDESTPATVDDVEREVCPSIDIRSTEGSEDEHDRRAILSPVREVEKEADDEDVMTVIPPNELFEGAGESAVVSGDTFDQIDEVGSANELATISAESSTETDSVERTVDEKVDSKVSRDTTTDPADEPVTTISIPDEVEASKPGLAEEISTSIEADAPVEPVPVVENIEGETQEPTHSTVPEQVVEEVPRTPQFVPAQPDALPVTTLDESAILDPDIEWTDHEYGKSLESIDESLEEINREDTEMDVAPPSPIMIDVDNLLAPAEHEALEEQKDILSDEKVGVQRAEDVAVTEESRELPGAFVEDEEQIPEGFAAVEPNLQLLPSSGGLDHLDQPSESEKIVNEFHKGISDVPADASNTIPPELPPSTTITLAENTGLISDAQTSTTVEPPRDVEDSPELELVELLRSSQQFKEARANAVSAVRSVDGGASDDFDGMSDTVFSAANSGHPSDDEELSSSWRWMKKPASRLHNQSVNGQSSEFRMRRRSHSMSSVEHERVPSFLNPSTEGSQGSQGGRKDEDISLVRSSSWAVSCFVCGVLVTLFVISSQRRDLLTGHRLT